MKPTGEVWLSILLPDGGQVCICDDIMWGAETLYWHNHTVYRLDKNGDVVWQVKRDEGPWVVWGEAREAAERDNDRGRDGALYVSQFLVIWLRFPDGSTNELPFPRDHAFPKLDVWRNDATIMLSTIDARTYELDIETGVAKNVEPFFLKREW